MSASASPFNPRLVFGMIAAGIVAFAVLMLLVAYGDRIGTGRDGRAHALSVSAVGFKGLTSLVAAFTEVHIDESRDEWSDHLLIVTLEPGNGAQEVRHLLERRSGAPTLLILPKWLTVDDPLRRGWVRAVGPGAAEMGGPLLGDEVRVSQGRARAPAALAGEDILEGLAIPVPPAAQQVAGPGLVPLAELPGGGALIARIGDEPHYVLADPDLMNNHGLRHPERARAALAIIERLNEGDEFVDFDVTMNRLGGGGVADGRSLLRLSFEPPFLPMTLALLAAALLAGLHGARRFGPVRREARAIAFGKAALVENSAGLIRQANREVELGAAYVDVVRQDVARLTHAPPGADEDGVDMHLNRLGPPDRPSFGELAARLYAARDRHAVTAAARALFQWKKDIIR